MRNNTVHYQTVYYKTAQSITTQHIATQHNKTEHNIIKGDSIFKESRFVNFFTTYLDYITRILRTNSRVCDHYMFIYLV